MSITVHDILNKQTGKCEAQSQKENIDTTMCGTGARPIIHREPRNRSDLHLEELEGLHKR